jgi:hypothetical protein
MPVKKKRTAKKVTVKKSTAKKTILTPLAQTETLQKDIQKSQIKLEKTYAKFLIQFKKQRERFRIRIKEAREKFSLAKTSYRKTNIKNMIKALEEKKKDLTHQLKVVSDQYKKFLAQQKILHKFEHDYEKKIQQSARKRQKKRTQKKAASRSQSISVEKNTPPEASDTLEENN